MRCDAMGGRDVMDARGGEEGGQKGVSGAGIFFMKVHFSPPAASATVVCTAVEQGTLPAGVSAV